MNGEKGLTLVEVIVAILIVAIIALSALQFYVFCNKFFITTTTRKLMAANFARETMERLYFLEDNAPALDINAVAYSDDLPVSDTDINNPLLESYGGSRSYKVSLGSDTNYKVVEVLVDWNK